MSAPGQPRLLVFARVPVPGRVKTRLIGALGEQGAAAVHLLLLRRTLEAATGLAEVERELWWDGAPAPGDRGPGGRSGRRLWHDRAGAAGRRSR